MAAMRVICYMKWYLCHSTFQSEGSHAWFILLVMVMITNDNLSRIKSDRCQLSIYEKFSWNFILMWCVSISKMPQFHTIVFNSLRVTSPWVWPSYMSKWKDFQGISPSCDMHPCAKPPKVTALCFISIYNFMVVMKFLSKNYQLKSPMWWQLINISFYI